MLSESRKADRAAMASQVETLCDELGVEHERSDYMDAGDIGIEIHGPRGLDVRVEFERRTSQPNVFCLAWNIGLRSDARLADFFSLTQNSDVNQYHHSKCTAFAHGFAELLTMLRDGLVAAKEGYAFDLKREAAHIAKDGTWQARMAQWDAWRAEEDAKRPSAN